MVAVELVDHVAERAVDEDQLAAAPCRRRPRVHRLHRAEPAFRRIGDRLIGREHCLLRRSGVTVIGAGDPALEDGDRRPGIAPTDEEDGTERGERKSTRRASSHSCAARMPSTDWKTQNSNVPTLWQLTYDK